MSANIKTWQERRGLFQYDAMAAEIADLRAALAAETAALADAVRHIGRLRGERNALAAATAPQPVAGQYDAGRQQGRAEALAILMGLDPENGIDEYAGWSTSVGPEDEGAAYWDSEKLRELFAVDGSLADMMDKAEAEYWRYQGLQDEAEHAKNFAANMHGSGKVRAILAKAGEFDLMGQLCSTAPAPIAQPVAGDERAAFEAWWGGFSGGRPDWSYAAPCALRWDAWQARAAQSARQIATLHAVIGELTAEREGWQWVPKALSEEMEVAFCEAWFSKVRCIDDPEMADAYQALLDHAPAAPTGSGE